MPCPCNDVRAVDIHHEGVRVPSGPQRVQQKAKRDFCLVGMNNAKVGTYLCINVDELLDYHCNLFVLV